MLTIEYQLAGGRCAHCDASYRVVRGPVLHDRESAGIYLAGLHSCNGERMAVITISLMPEDEPFAFTIQARAGKEQYEMVFVHSALSPWAAVGYLGRLLTVEEARESELRDTVFEVADLICETIPQVTSYFDGPAEA